MVDPKEIMVITYPPNPVGGQHVGTGNTGVRLTHAPTGIIICVNVGRSQHRNKQIAMDALLGALTSPHYIER